MVVMQNSCKDLLIANYYYKLFLLCIRSNIYILFLLDNEFIGCSLSRYYSCLWYRWKRTMFIMHVEISAKCRTRHEMIKRKLCWYLEWDVSRTYEGKFHQLDPWFNCCYQLFGSIRTSNWIGMSMKLSSDCFVRDFWAFDMVTRCVFLSNLTSKFYDKGKSTMEGEC